MAILPSKSIPSPKILFSQIFDVADEKLVSVDAFDISLVTDLPLFIDPFLLFSSEKSEYKSLHDAIIRYLTFLREKSAGGVVSEGQLDAWYRFKEVEETWLGFCQTGNGGHGLGKKFARALNENFNALFSDFGEEKITRGTHLEKLCLITGGVGRDTISDFTTNLIKGYLLRYTEDFAKAHIDKKYCRAVSVPRAEFDYKLERWVAKGYHLPVYSGRHVILTPKDILTKDETWINKHDVFATFDDIPTAIPNQQLRAEVNNYFAKMLPPRATKKERAESIAKTLLKFPSIIDYYIRQKEDAGDEAKNRSIDLVLASQRMFVECSSALAEILARESDFYGVEPDSKQATKKRILFLKDVIENKGGYRFFYSGSNPVGSEEDLQVMFRLTWYATRFDVSREVNDGRGPVDFKVSHGVSDKTLVEMKLASNTQLKANLENQLEVYQKSSDAKKGFKVIIFFTLTEQRRVERILRELNMTDVHNVILIDGRKDNKPSASKATFH